MRVASDPFMIKNQRASSLENPLAYNYIPPEIIQEYAQQLNHSGKKMFKPFQPNMSNSNNNNNNALPSMQMQEYSQNVNRGGDAMMGDGFENEQYYNSFKSNNSQGGGYQGVLHDLASDDRQERYLEYLQKIRVPQKDVHQYLSTYDIEGAQPKRLDLVKGKKKFDFFKGVEENVNNYYNSRYIGGESKKNYASVGPKQQDQIKNLRLDQLQTQSQEDGDMNNINANSMISLQNKSSQISKQSQIGKEDSTKVSQLNQYNSMSNYDKLYNKRMDWRPLVAANKEKFINTEQLQDGSSPQIGISVKSGLLTADQGRERNALKQSGVQQMLMANQGIKRENRKNQSQVNYGLKFGVPLPNKNQTSSSEYGKYY